MTGPDTPFIKRLTANIFVEPPLHYVDGVLLAPEDREDLGEAPVELTALIGRDET